MKRLLPPLVGLVLGVAALIFLTSQGSTTASEIRENAGANEALAESAPQQQVVALWAIRDAQAAEVEASGLRNGILALCAALLAAIAFSVALREPREAPRVIADAPRPSAGYAATPPGPPQGSAPEGSSTG